MSSPRKRKISSIVSLRGTSNEESSKKANSLMAFNDRSSDEVTISEEISLSNLNISDTQIMVLLQDYLNNHGFKDLATELSTRTGIPIYHNGAETIAEYIFSRKYDQAVDSIPQLFPLESEENLILLAKYIINAILVELLAINEASVALKLIRTYTSKIPYNSNEIHKIIRKILDERYYTQFQIVDEHIRKKNIIASINKLASFTVISDTDRLKMLMRYAVMYQMDKCLYHSENDAPRLLYSLYKNHKCDTKILPSKVFQTINTCRSNIWNVTFSPDGENFLIFGQDKDIVIYRHSDYHDMFVKYKTLYFDAIPLMAKWSPNSWSILVACTSSRYLVYNCLFRRDPPHDTVPQIVGLNEVATCIDWLPDSDRYVVGTNNGNLILSNSLSQIVNRLHGYRAVCIGYLEPNRVIFVDTMNRIMEWDLVCSDVKTLWISDISISSFSICPDGRHLILNVCGHGLFLFNTSPPTIARRYVGAVNQQSIVKCSFMPGVSYKIFCTPSEDGKILYWNLDKEYPIGSSNVSDEYPVSSVSWCPSDPHTIVSVLLNGVIHVFKSPSSIYT